MATGVETAGLLLAIFPLVISFSEHYQEGCDRIAEYRRFRIELCSFTVQIMGQSYRFRKNLEQLLSPIVVSDEHFEKLYQNPGGPAWKEPRLEKKLETHLSGSYKHYHTIMIDLKKTLEKLKEKLLITDVRE